MPPRFGTEVVARLLGLRLDHPAAEDALELAPGDPATRAEAAYSAAQILGFSGWEVAAVQAAPTLSRCRRSRTGRRAILDTAVARIGMPYVWGGTSDGPETDFGVSARGGYDCSGFVWRVYKLTAVPERVVRSRSTLRGRTTYVMSGEVPALEAHRLRRPPARRRPLLRRQGARVAARPRSTTWRIYLGNGWFIQSSEYGVALATLNGWYYGTNSRGRGGRSPRPD